MDSSSGVHDSECAIDCDSGSDSEWASDDSFDANFSRVPINATLRPSRSLITLGLTASKEQPNLRSNLPPFLDLHDGTTDPDDTALMMRIARKPRSNPENPQSNPHKPRPSPRKPQPNPRNPLSNPRAERPRPRDVPRSRALSPRGTRRQMVADELSKSLRREVARQRKPLASEHNGSLIIQNSHDSIRPRKHVQMNNDFGHSWWESASNNQPHW